MARRPLNDEQVEVLRRILSGGHPSPGSTYMRGPNMLTCKHGYNQPRHCINCVTDELTKARALLRDHTCDYRIGHPLVTRPCAICRYLKDHP